MLVTLACWLMVATPATTVPSVGADKAGRAVRLRPKRADLTRVNLKVRGGGLVKGFLALLGAGAVGFAKFTDGLVSGSTGVIDDAVDVVHGLAFCCGLNVTRCLLITLVYQLLIKKQVCFGAWDCVVTKSIQNKPKVGQFPFCPRFGMIYQIFNKVIHAYS